MRPHTPVWGSGALLLLAVLLLVAPASMALVDLEQEEDISNLLPNSFPVGDGRETVAERSWAILPQVGFGPDTGLAAGVKFTDRNTWGTGVVFDLDGTVAVEGQQSLAFSVASHTLWDGRLIFLLRGKYDLDPQREFFGLGNNDVGPDPLTTHLFQEIGGAVTIGYRPFERLAFNFSIGVRDVDIRRGERRCCIMFTPDAPEFADLPGIQGGMTNPIALSLVWNTRDDVMRPSRGWRVILKAIHTDKTLFSDFEFTRYIFDAGYLRAVLPKRRMVLGLRVNGEWIDAPSRDIPFWELTELGGADSLRGFYPHRFLGKGRLLLNGESRFKLVDFNFFDWWQVRIDGVVFADGGRVFIDRGDLKDEFRLDSEIIGRVIDNFQYDYGGGIRIGLSEALVARIDAGFSDENTGLVYLTFGQTF